MTLQISFFRTAAILSQMLLWLVDGVAHEVPGTRHSQADNQTDRQDRQVGAAIHRHVREGSGGTECAVEARVVIEASIVRNVAGRAGYVGGGQKLLPGVQRLDVVGLVHCVSNLCCATQEEEEEEEEATETGNSEAGAVCALGY